MYPAYRCMDSFPHQRNQMPYTQHYYPSFEGIPYPPQVNVDPSKSPITYETWPYGGSYGCSIPVVCHGCCNHNHFPSYGGFRPPYPHFPSPSPFQCHGGYPSFPETYPVHYVPFAHYSVDQP